MADKGTRLVVLKTIPCVGDTHHSRGNAFLCIPGMYWLTHENTVDYLKAYTCLMISQQNRAIMKQRIALKISSGKQFIYRFNGDPSHDETVSDSAGALPFHMVGDILKKRGKMWRVAVVRNDLNMIASRKAVPLHHVFLTDKF